jgi:hypothetical protein
MCFPFDIVIYFRYFFSVFSGKKERKKRKKEKKRKKKKKEKKEKQKKKIYFLKYTLGSSLICSKCTRVSYLDFYCYPSQVFVVVKGLPV